MSSAVPDGWKLDRLEKHVDILSGFPFKSQYFSSNPSNIGLIRIRDLTNQEVGTFYDGEYSDDFLIRKGDVLIGMDGDFHIVKWQVREALLNQRICKVSAKQSGQFDTDFLFHALRPELKNINESTGATTVKHLSVKDVRNIEKPFPPLPEQKKIASILTSVDEVIEKTESQIAKLQDLKTGMMQELLTKGIGHTEFKDSPIGMIPVGWKYEAVGKLVESYSYGPRFNAKNYDSRGNVRTIRGTDVSANGNIKYEQVPLALLDETTVEKHKLLESDIIMITTADCGVTGIFHQQKIPFICSAYAIRLRPTEAINSYYFAFYMQTEAAQRTVDSYIRKGTVANLPGSDVLKISLPVPTRSEQDRIVAILSSVDRNIERSKDRLSKVQSTKKALMQDLLTGKVRVRTD